MNLTVENWRSEYKRLEFRYNKVADPASSEARGLLDHMHAVKLILADMGDNMNLKEEN